MDTVIFIAFCVFVLLLGIRIKQRWQPGKKEEEASVSEEEEIPETCIVRNNRLRKERRRSIFLWIQLMILAVLSVYMIPFLIRDFTAGNPMPLVNIILRCLIFVFTIYIFASGCMKVFCKRNKANIKK